MDIQYSYTHTCYHVAYGPVVSNPLIYLPLLTHTHPYPNHPIQKFTIPLPFRCPFCQNPTIHSSVSAGEGLLVILEAREPRNPESSSHSSPFTETTPSSSVESTQIPLSYQSEQAASRDAWTILKICDAENIRSEEWAQGIKIEEQGVNDHDDMHMHEYGVIGQWGERRRNFGPREGRWTPMAWITRPIGKVHILNRGVGSERSSHSDPDLQLSYGSMLHVSERQCGIKISNSYRGNMGQDASGYGWRGRVLAKSRLPGIISELGAVLRTREGWSMRDLR